MEQKWLIPVPPEMVVLDAWFEGNPVPHARPRVGNYGRVYTPEKTETYKEFIAWRIKALMARHIDTPDTRYGVQAFFARSTRHRVDVDNLLKSILDAATRSGVWGDDSQVREVAARLEIAQETPGAHVRIYRVSESEVVADRYKPPICGTCGNAILRTHPSTSHLYRFCSRECYAASTKVTLNCAQCHQPFEILKSQMRSPGNKKSGPYSRQFCSRECSIEFNRARVRVKGKESDKWICQKCGGRVSRKEYTVCRGCSMASRSDPSTNYWKLRHAKGLAK